MESEFFELAAELAAHITDQTGYQFDFENLIKDLEQALDNNKK